MIAKTETFSSTQKVYAEYLPRMAGKFRNLVLLDSNLGSIIGANKFEEVFPERYFNFGNGISNMIASASGFAVRGKIPFVNSFSLPVTSKSLDQVRNYLCMPNLNIKLIGVCNGLLCGEEGAAVQAFEDIANMRNIPNMKVACPADAVEAKKVLDTMMDDYGPTYLRLFNLSMPIIYNESHSFEFGKGHIYKQGGDICIISYGSTLHTSLDAAGILEREGYSVMVVNMASIKPIDEFLIVECAKSARHLVTVEDHNICGGLGSAVAESLSENYPVKLLRIGMKAFGESGKVTDLYKKYRLDGEGISDQIREWIKK